MSRGRLVLVAAVVLAIVGLVNLGGGERVPHPDPRSDVTADRVGEQDDLSSTWFCVAGTAPGDPAPSHRLYVSNAGDDEAEARISVYGNDGPGDQKVVIVDPLRTLVVDIDAEFGAHGLSAMVESPSGSVGVSHYVASSENADTTPCQRNSSPVAYFPSQTTLLGTTAHLVVLNPFPTDASVDLVAAVADGIRAPTEWTGMVVPAGTSRTIDLSEQVQRRDQFSLSMRVRSGRAFAETVQTYSGVTVEPAERVQGLRLSAPVDDPRPSWTFAGGFTDPGATEVVVVQNPTENTVEVSVQVVPNGSVDMAPEPFGLSVPAGRYAMLDLSAEGRVPDVGFHSIVVESTDGSPIIATRRVSLSAEVEEDDDRPASQRPALGRGVASSNGVAGAARKWWATNIAVGGSNTPLMWIRNPGDGAVEVSITGTTRTGEVLEVADGETIPGSDSVTVPLGGVSGKPTPVMYLIEASGPVVVEQLVTYDGIPDMSIAPAFPLGG